MAIIFNDELANNLGYHIYNQISVPKILIHSGTQPSLADFTTNWSSMYYYDFDANTQGPNTLVGYGDLRNTGSSNDVITLLGNSSQQVTSVSLSDTSFASHYFNDGTATFASVHYAGTWGSLYTSTSFWYYGNFILVPVSDASGTGVIKLASTTISGSAPSMTSFDIAFS